MITEDYVSFETAKLLKEKGFDVECLAIYYPDSRLETFDLAFNYNIPGGISGVISAPTLQMAMKWLEEKYEIFCDIRRHGNVDDDFTYSWNCEGKRGLSVGNGGGLKTAAEARESAIRYCLENLI